MALVLSSAASALSMNSPILGVDDGRTQCHHLPTVDRRACGRDPQLVQVVGGAFVALYVAWR